MLMLNDAEDAVITPTGNFVCKPKWDFVESLCNGYGWFKCVQTGEMCAKPIKRKGLSFSAEVYFFGEESTIKRRGF